MFESRRQHPVAAITKVLEIIRGNFITILLILFVGGGGDSETLINVTWILGTIVVLLVWGILSWLRFSYRIEEDQLVIEQGVLMRQKLYISKDRIQVIDITSGIVQRLFGLVEVQVKTAGSSSKEAKISAVTQEVAKELREKLRKENGKPVAEEEDEEQPTKVYRLGAKDLVIAASTSGRLGVALSIVGTVFSQVDQVVSEEQMVRYLESVIPTTASTTLIVSSIIFILVVSWILSFLGTVITYGNFAVRLKEDELIISHGIFERKQLTIPYNRVQAIQVKEELMRQPLGYVTLKLDSAGYGDEGGKSVTLFPLLPRKKVTEFIESVLPEYAEQSYTLRPPQKSLRRYIFRSVLTSLLIIVPLWLLLPFGYYPMGLVLLAVLLGYMQYKDAAIGANENTMILRYRLLSRNTVILKRYRVQTVSTSANPFQNRRQLADFTVTVASGSEGHQFTVRDLDADQVHQLWQWPSVHTDSRAIPKEETPATLPAF
ncbi:PH domain-containing protein [Aliifodinibius sp. S!AR15-10]|uniref:PH domain-containing protein n=1 Tax=Aliifodinibius sp. S!AR15-10 TaxID=2950437 RepID=UPI0028617A65|nr:PH domain-containing protein [Aliifodinibius sp. S!AR15-10]MDR8389599.1 PH domain-containing protein [Aliifodinibius sp. S!AR15-10]